MLLRNLWRRQTRTILTLLGIAVGIAALVALVALSKGLAAGYVEVTKSSGADITIQAVQGEGQAMTIGTSFDEQVLDQVRNMPDVKSASGMLYTAVPLPPVPFFLIFGYEPQQPGIQHFKVVRGLPLAGDRGRSGGKPMILGKIAADNLRKDLGDTIRLEGTTFRVVGIYETGVAMEDAGAVISLRDAQTTASMPRQVMFISIRLHRPERAAEFKARLSRILPKDVEVAGTQAGGMMLDFLEMFDVFAWGVAIVAALVGGVGMMNTMLMSIYERTREIGVLRAVGWKPSRVLGMILGESLILSLLGGLLGLGMGMLLTWLAARTPALRGMTRATVPLSLLIQALTTAIVLGLVGGLYPAWRASRMPPVEALSYDGGLATKRIFQTRWGGMTWQNLLRQRTRTLLALVGVGMGVLGMILIGNLVEGFVVALNATYSGTEITAVEGGLADTSLSAIDQRTVERIETIPDVQYTAGSIFGIITMPETALFVVFGRDPRDPALSPRILREGAFLSGRRQALLGWKAAAEQDKRIGDRIQMFGSSFTVVGIVQTGNAYEDSGAIISLREAQQLMKKPRQVMILQIKLEDPGQVDAMLSRLSAEYPKLLFSKSAEFTENLPDMQNSAAALNGIFVLMTLVGSIALMNTMIMSVYERTREIGVLRAVGWRRRMILRQTLQESLLLTLLSGLLSVLGTLIVKVLMGLLPSAGLLRDMFILSPRVILLSLGLCLLLGALGGLYPAWRATKLSPVEALRYE